MIDFSFFLERNYAIVHIEGKNSLFEFIAATSEFGEREEFSRGLHRVCDFRHADMTDLNTLDFLRYVRFARKLPIARRTKVALVGTRQSSLLLMFANRMSSLEIKVFVDLDSAVHWIEEDLPHVEESPPLESFTSEQIKYHYVAGSFGLEEAIAMQLSWVQHEDYARDIPIVWDLRKVELDVSLPQVFSGAAALYQNRQNNGQIGRTALLVSSKRQEIMLRSALSSGIESGQLNVFAAPEPAHAWVLSPS